MVTYHMWNLTEFTNSSSGSASLGLVHGISGQMWYVPGMVILISVMLVMIFILRQKGYGFLTSLATASWVCMIISILAYPTGLINGVMLIGFISLVPLTTLAMFLMSGD